MFDEQMAIESDTRYSGASDARGRMYSVSVLGLVKVTRGGRHEGQLGNR